MLINCRESLGFEHRHRRELTPSAYHYARHACRFWSVDNEGVYAGVYDCFFVLEVVVGRLMVGISRPNVFHPSLLLVLHRVTVHSHEVILGSPLVEDAYYLAVS